MLRLLAFAAFGLLLLGTAASGFTGIADANAIPEAAAQESADGFRTGG